MENPNNCGTCDHIEHPDGGHCYMFREAPTDVCFVHTGRRHSTTGYSALIKRAIADVELDLKSDVENPNAVL